MSTQPDGTRGTGEDVVIDVRGRRHAHEGVERRVAETPSVLSVNVGLPRAVPWQSRTVFTGVFKQPVTGPRMVRRLNVEGDGQGDTAGHGGEQRAVLVYQIA